MALRPIFGLAAWKTQLISTSHPKGENPSLASRLSRPSPFRVGVHFSRLHDGGFLSKKSAWLMSTGFVAGFQGKPQGNLGGSVFRHTHAFVIVCFTWDWQVLGVQSVGGLYRNHIDSRMTHWGFKATNLGRHHRQVVCLTWQGRVFLPGGFERWNGQ